MIAVEVDRDGFVVPPRWPLVGDRVELAGGRSPGVVTDNEQEKNGRATVTYVTDAGQHRWVYASEIRRVIRGQALETVILGVPQGAEQVSPCSQAAPAFREAAE